MKKFSKKGVLLFAAAMALCAFAMPTMAGAASWTVANSEHTLNSTNVGFTATTDIGLTIQSQCTSSSFTGTVNGTGSAIEVTAATFGGDCTAIIGGAAVGRCTVDATARQLPWTATPTGVGTAGVTIDGLHVGVTFTTGVGIGACPLAGQPFTITGRVTSGATYSNASRTLTLSNAEGLVSHSAAAGNGTPVTARGTFVDAQNSLTLDH